MLCYRALLYSLRGRVQVRNRPMIRRYPRIIRVIRTARLIWLTVAGRASRIWVTSRSNRRRVLISYSNINHSRSPKDKISTCCDIAFSKITLSQIQVAACLRPAIRAMPLLEDKPWNNRWTICILRMDMVICRKIRKCSKPCRSRTRFRNKWAKNISSSCYNNSRMERIFKIRLLVIVKPWCNWRTNSTRLRKMWQRCRSICCWGIRIRLIRRLK